MGVDFFPTVGVADLKANLNATTAPGASNDGTEDYGVGSLWTDTTANKSYTCLDNSTGAAIWTETTQAGGVGGSTGSTDNKLLRADGTGGSTMQTSGISVDDSDNMSLGNVGGMTVARISGSTFSTVQHLQDVFHSAGWVSGGGITDDADGTITVAAGTGLIRATDSPTAQILFNDWALEAGTNVALPDNDISWIYVEYNSGSPRVIATITERSDVNTNILLGLVQRTGTTLHINTEDKHVVGDHANSMIRRMKETMPWAQVSGGIISEVGTINIALTAGSFWQGLTEFSTSAFDSSAAGRFSYWYRKVGDSGWNEVVTQAAIDNTQYDDNSGSLATLSNNKYGVHWVYLEVDGDVDVLYGQGDFTLSQAENAQPPSGVPEKIMTHGFLVGKIIIKKSDVAFTQIESSFQTTFSGTLAQDHGSLSGLADDDHTQYSLVDGTRAFSGKVQGVSPVASDNAATLVTKSYAEAPLAVVNVDMLTVATTDLYTVPSGKKLISLHILVRCTASTAPAFGNIGSVGSNSTPFDNLLFTFGFIPTTVDNVADQGSLGSTGVFPALPAATVVKVNVTTGDGGTALNCDFILIGKLV